MDKIFKNTFRSGLIYIYSAGLLQPIFYNLLSGNMREVKAFKQCIQESGIQEVTVIADKGFYSKANVEFIQQAEWQFIIPLKRDSSLIVYKTLEKQNNNYFKFENRYIWYQIITSDKTPVVNEQTELLNPTHYVYLFIDPRLKEQETKDYLDRIENNPEKYHFNTFKQKEDTLGTIALYTNCKNKTPEEVYKTYKSRLQIEIMFDSYKNILEADKTYMQDEDALNGWLFISHITLQWYYIIYELLKKHELLKKYSVKDFIEYLYEIKKVKINETWVTEPITKQTLKLLEKLNLSVT